MHEPAPAMDEPLKVAVMSRVAVRLAGLEALVRAAGHQIVARVVDADVVLADAGEHAEHPAVVSLGGDADAAGLLGRDPDARQIDAALRAVAAGLSVRLQGGGFEDEQEPEVLLTPRELEVLNAIGEGMSNKEIARRLDISQHTVKFHVESLFRKLEVRSRAEAIAKSMALRRNRIEL